MFQKHPSAAGLSEFLSTGQAARILGVAPQAVWLMVINGRLPGMQVGRTWIIPRDALLEFAKTYVKGPGRRKPKAQEGDQA